MPQEIPANHANLQDVAATLRLSEVAYLRAIELAELRPSREVWLRYLDHFLTGVGVLFVVAGIAAFFAWNWADLGHMAKFALIQGGIVGAVALAWRFGLESMVGKSSLFAAAFLTGTLLAVFGQVYQTGADPYGLFLAWAILILPWAIIGRQVGIWILIQVLLNLTVIMYYTQVLHPPDGWWQLAQLLGPLVWLGSTLTDSTLASYLFALNGLAVVIWEFGASRGVVWMQGTLFQRLYAIAALTTVLIPTLIIVIAASLDETTRLRTISPILLVAATSASIYYYQYKRHDLLILTSCLLGVIMVITTFFARHLLESEGGLLGLAVLVIAQVAGAAWWLREVSRRWERDS